MSTGTAAMTGPVVAGIDGSVHGLAVAEAAAGQAIRHGRALRLVHGFNQVILYAAFGYPIDGLQAEALVELANTMLEETATTVRLGHPDLQVQTELVASGAAAALIEASRTASLVVVGNRGHGGFAGLLLGSISSQVIAHAHGPVLVTRPAATGDGPAGPVVVGLDGSAESSAALGFAFDEASIRGVPLVALYVWQALPPENLGPIRPWHYDPDEAAEEARRLLAEQIAGWREKYPDVTVEQRAQFGYHPAEALIEASHTAGVVVVGSRGRGGFSGLLLGSVSRTVAESADSPVAVIHRPGS